MSENQDYLDPNRVHTIYMPSAELVVLDGSRKAKMIEFVFEYDGYDTISLKGRIAGEDEDYYMSNLAVSVERMKEMLLYCCNHSSHLTEAFPDEVGTAIDDIKQAALEGVGSANTIGIGEVLALRNISGKICHSPKLSDTFYAFENATIECSSVPAAKRGEPSSLTVEITIDVALPLRGRDTVKQIIDANQGTLVVFIDTDTGEAYRIAGCTIHTSNELDSQFGTCNMVIQGSGIKRTVLKRTKNIIPLPSIISSSPLSNGTQKGGSAQKKRMHDVLASRIVSDSVEQFKKDLGIVDTKKSPAGSDGPSKNRARERFSKIISSD